MLALGGVLAAAVAAPHAVARIAGRPVPWAEWVLPSSMLLAASGVWLRGAADAPPVLRGGRRSWAGAVPALVLTAAMMAASIAWPAHPSAPGVARLLPAASVVLLVPVAEELFFRGVLLTHLRRQLGSLAATAAVSLLFGFLHSPAGQLWTMLTGSAVLCVVTLVTGTLLWPVVLHMAWNTLSVVVSSPPSRERLILGLVVTTVCLLAIGRGLARGTARERDVR